MADSETTNIGLIKPENGASADDWGIKWNDNADDIDAIFAGDGSGTPVGMNFDGKAVTLPGSGKIDSSGNIGIGATPEAWGDGYAAMRFGYAGAIWNATSSSITTALSSNMFYDGAYKRITADSAGVGVYTIAGKAHAWYAAAPGAADSTFSLTERMRISVNGFLHVGGYHVGDSSHFLQQDTNDWIWRAYNTHGSSPYGFIISYTNAAPNNTSDNNLFLQCTDVSGNRLYIRSNGNVVNANNAFGAISDAKFKSNIERAASQWEDIKALSLLVSKYDLCTAPEGSPKQLGLVAQEAELVSPGLVDTCEDMDAEHNGIGTYTKSLKYSVLYMKAVKALGEALIEIDALKTRVSTLEAAGSS